MCGAFFPPLPFVVLGFGLRFLPRRCGGSTLWTGNPSNASTHSLNIVRGSCHAPYMVGARRRMYGEGRSCACSPSAGKSDQRLLDLLTSHAIPWTGIRKRSERKSKRNLRLQRLPPPTTRESTLVGGKGNRILAEDQWPWHDSIRLTPRMERAFPAR